MDLNNFVFHERSKKAKIVLFWVLEKGCLSTWERKRKAKRKLKMRLKLCDKFKNHSFVNLEFSTGIERVIMT